MNEKWIYVTEKDNSVRYILGTQGKKTLCCIGINPSTAEPSRLDNTIRSVNRIAKNNNYDSFIMFNVYPVRSTIFDKLSKEENKEYIKRNIIEIKKVIKNLPKPVNIWLAYGDHIDGRKYTRECFNDLKKVLDEYECKYWCAGLTQSGNPKHPSRLKSQTKLQEYSDR